MKRFLILLFLAVAFLTLKVYYKAGQFKSIGNHFAGEVTRVYTTMPGPEDMQVDFATGNLFIAATDRRKLFAGVEGHKDGIYLLNLTTGGEPQQLAHNYPGAFHPHGLSLFREDSLLYVFVVNHNDGGDFVEVFRFTGTDLEHRQSYSAAAMCCPNDVLAVAVDKFYVTNDHGAKKGMLRFIEDYIRIPRASLLYSDGGQFVKAGGPYYYANGVNKSPDGGHLYLTTTTGASILVYAIAADGSLHNEYEQDLGTGVDNIDVDEEGNLWIAAHPRLLDFLNHARDSTRYSPSQVLKLTPRPGHNFVVEEIYLNDGSEVSGSSVAVHYHNQLFVGVVFDHKLLRATLK